MTSIAVPLTLVLKPPGRGKWAPVVVTIEGRHARFVEENAKPGLFLTLGSRQFRICEVRR